jgi:uncharacterized membrane protein
MTLRLSARAHVVYAALLMNVLAWLGVIYAAPWLAAGRHYTAALLLYSGFSAICHQLPERSFHLLGYPLAVCARCLGIYAGFLIGLLIYPLLRRVDEEATPARRWLLWAAAPAVIDYAGNAAGLFTNTFASRTVTGLIAGAAVAFYIFPGLVSIFRVRRREDDPHGQSPASLNAPDANLKAEV